MFTLKNHTSTSAEAICRYLNAKIVIILNKTKKIRNLLLIYRLIQNLLLVLHI